MPGKLAAMRGGEQLRQGGFDPVAEINVHTRPGIGLLFHLRKLNPQNDGRARKFHTDGFTIIQLEP